MLAKSRLLFAGLAVAIPLSLAGAAHAAPTDNEVLVKKAMTELFVKRDGTAPDRYWGEHYIQHNPGIADGRAELPIILKALPPTFKYEPGMVVGSGDIVMIHGRYTGWTTKPLVVVDIFRVEGGKLVEHWDVVQEETPAGQTKSGRPMFTPGE